MVGYIIASVFGLVGVLVVHCLIANAFAKCAEGKGYVRSSYFWLCFFFGTIAYAVIAALPDKVLNEKVRNILLQSSDKAK